MGGGNSSTRLSRKIGNHFGKGDTSEFRELYDKVCAGCPVAAQELHDKYSGYLLRVIRHRFLPKGSPLRRDRDSADFQQLAWQALLRSLLKKHAFLKEEDHFKRLMHKILFNEFRKFYRYRVRARKRSLHSEVECDLDEIAVDDDPAKQAEAADEDQYVVTRLSQREREAVIALRRGHFLLDIADNMGMSVRALIRMYDQIKRKVQKMQAARARREARENQGEPSCAESPSCDTLDTGSS